MPLPRVRSRVVGDRFNGLLLNQLHGPSSRSKNTSDSRRIDESEERSTEYRH